MRSDCFSHLRTYIRGWQAQADKVARGERSSVPLDDIRAHVSGVPHPNHTDDPHDDCRTHGIDYLDMAYMPKGNEGALLDRLVGQGVAVADAFGSEDE